MGLDEAYADLTGVEKPLRVLRELIDDVQKRDRHPDLGRRRPQPADRQVLLGPRQARRASWRWAARRRASASPPRRRCRLAGIGPKTAERLAELGYATVAQLQEADEAQLAARFGDRTARYLEGARDRSTTTRRSRPRRPGQVGLHRAHLRHATSPRHDELETILRTLSQRALRGPAGQVAPGAHRGDQGAPGRLDDGHARPHARRTPTNDTALVTETALELLRAYAPAAARAPARRPPGGLRRPRAR